MWKNLTFPLLTPIYTKYRESFRELQEHMGTAVTDTTNNKRISILEDELCKLLMRNYQIEESHTGYNTNNMNTHLSKGQVSCNLKMIGTNLFPSILVDPLKQDRIVPSMLYRYLSYEDKDCRFCSKYIYFKDKNHFTSARQTSLETKIVKYPSAYSGSPSAATSALTSPGPATPPPPSPTTSAGTTSPRGSRCRRGGTPSRTSSGCSTTSTGSWRSRSV